MHTNKEILQASLEELFDKNQLLERVEREFKESTIKFSEIFDKNRISHAFGFRVLAQMAIHRRCKIEVLVGLMWGFHKDAQATADELWACAEADIVDYDINAQCFVTIAQLSKDVQDEVDKFQYPLPFVIPPKDITNNKQNGYHYLSRGSVILKNNHHDDDVCLDHLNRLNAMKLTIDRRTVLMVQNQWRNLDKPKANEELSEYQKRVKAFNKYDKTSREVMNMLVIDADNEFHLGHKYDKRGRTYCQGYHVNYQGTAWNKAVVEFADKELI